MTGQALASGKLRLDRPAPHVARLTIDHPARRNALDHEILDALASTVAGLDDARCLLLTATGSVFSAGYDIGNLSPERFAERAEALVAHPFHDALDAVEQFQFPAVAALNGHTIGGGLELALACDLRVAAEGARLGMPPARLGLVYSHTGLRKFVATIGAPRTRELFFTARSVTAVTAERWGLVNEVVADEQLPARALEMAEKLVQGASGAFGATKRLIAQSLGPLESQMVLESETIARQAVSPEGREGVSAFLEKRKPRFPDTDSR